MKKSILFAAASFLFSAFSLNAQSKTWDFSNDTANWPINAGIGNTPMVKDGLGLFPISTNTNFAAITNSSQVSFSDGYVATGNRLQTNGGGAVSTGTYHPTQRYFFIEVSGPVTFKAWYKAGSTGAVRTTFVSNGYATLYGSAATSPAASPADTAILTATIPTAGTFYVYTDAAINFYKMEVSGANVVTTLNSNQLSAIDSSVKVSANIFTNGSDLHIANLSGNTKVNVYTANGALVKTLETKSDVNFGLKTGLYIVNVQTDKGVKSQKVLIK
ncbi:T9SS type A sorting domain-containing protein [Candidatus Kaistella beijingensis]|uniref:T9SS type A sorting domain-containing protein n=1 Tax=Candidatus Kaistella beijingensis TaxID=2820270 RepID=UPI001CC63FC2|nr:T9SS type A sorting domain-containing protein [Candidatus Kaistella beijingensis]UBB88649.1 T9SS type A sorting domain-containing protein [Candidatus Kaistella beijingensis]